MRANGLPQVVRPAARVRGFVHRCAPFLFALLVAGLLWQAAFALLPDDVLLSGDLAPERDPAQAAAVLLVLAAPVVAVCAGVLAGAVRRRLSPLPRSVLGVLVAVAFLLLPGMVGGPVRAGLGSQAVVLLLVLALGYLGVGSVLVWAWRRSWHEVGTLAPMVVWVLPVLMLTVLFLFFNAEIWQVATGIDWPRTWGIAAVLLGLSLVVIVVTAADELRSLSLHPVSDTDEDLLEGTPTPGATSTTPPRPPSCASANASTSCSCPSRARPPRSSCSACS